MRVLILGASGQDGRLLATQLTSAGHEVDGLSRRWTGTVAGLLRRHWPVDVRDTHAVGDVIRAVSPDVVFVLAAYHHASDDRQRASVSLRTYFEVNVETLETVLDVVRANLPATRVCYAASCHVFGSPMEHPQTEDSAMRPTTFYGITKLAGLGVCRHYRVAHGLHVSAAILYNHESPLRAASFLTAKIASAAAAASRGQGQVLEIRDLDAVVDWCAAGDAVQAMWLMTQHDVPDDYIVASGVPRTVRAFADAAFGAVDLAAADWVRANPSAEVMRPPHPYLGDPSKIRGVLGWQPRVPFEQVVREMVYQRLTVL